MMNIEEQKSAIKGMPIPDLVRLYPMAAADQKFLILGEIDRQKKIAAEEAIKQGQNERSVEQDIMQEATGIAAAQNMINRPVSEMETVSRYAGIPTQLAENQPEMSPDDIMAAGGVASLDAGRMDLAEGGIIAFQEGGLTIPSYATTDISSALPQRPTGFFGYGDVNPVGMMDPVLGSLNFARYAELKRKQQGAGFNQEPLTPAEASELNLIEKQIAESKKEKVPEVKAPSLSEIDVTPDTTSKVEDKPIVEEPKSIFEKEQAPNIDEMFKDEDVEGLAEREAERFKTMMGENEAYKKSQERLAKREKDIAEEERVNPWMALTEFGFSWAASKEQNPIVSAGQAGQKGLEAYTKGKNRIRDMEDKAIALEADIENARRQEELMYKKFGLESENTRRAANDRRLIERDKAKLDMYKTNLATKLEQQKIDVMRERIKSADRATSAKLKKLVQEASESILTKTDYPDRRKALLNKYNGDESNPSFQREDQILYDGYLSKMISDEDVYGSANTMSLDPLDADQLLNFGS